LNSASSGQEIAISRIRRVRFGMRRPKQWIMQSGPTTWTKAFKPFRLCFPARARGQQPLEATRYPAQRPHELRRLR
jgi:hypothetical protein